MPGPFCTIIKCLQKRPGLGCRGYWPLSPSISGRIWSKTVQNTPFPFKYDLRCPVGGPFCTVGSCRTVRVWVVVYNLDMCVSKSKHVSIEFGPNQSKISMTVPFYFDFARTILHGSYCQMYNVELSGFDLSYNLDWAFQNQFPSNLVQTSPKYECQSCFVTI